MSLTLLNVWCMQTWKNKHTHWHTDYDSVTVETQVVPPKVMLCFDFRNTNAHTKNVLLVLQRKHDCLLFIFWPLPVWPVSDFSLQCKCFTKDVQKRIWTFIFQAFKSKKSVLTGQTFYVLHFLVILPHHDPTWGHFIFFGVTKSSSSFELIW